MIRSGALIERCAVDPAVLSRWAKAGYLTPLPQRWEGSGYPRTWPDWTPRMVALLQTVHISGGARPEAISDPQRSLRSLLLDVASCLAEHPDVPYAVRVDGGPTRPAWTPEEVDRLCADVTLRAEVVCIPA